MAQAECNLHMGIGESQGSVKICQRCGGTLSLQDGTDPEQTDALGGFEETYQCEHCKATGTYKFRYKDSKEAFMGVCANFD